MRVSTKTCAERLRALRLLRHEDDICEAPAAPLADLRHVLLECQGVEAPAVRLQKMQQEVEGMIGSLRPLGAGAQECINAKCPTGS